MARTHTREPGVTDLALGLKAAAIVVVLGLIAAIADHALVVPAEMPLAMSAPRASAPAAAAEPRTLAVPFAVNAGEVEAPAPTF